MLKLRCFLILTPVFASFGWSLFSGRPLMANANGQELSWDERYTLCSQFPLNSACEGWDIPVSLDGRPGIETHCWLDGGNQNPSNSCKFEIEGDSITAYVEHGEAIAQLDNRPGTQTLTFSDEEIWSWHYTNTISGSQNALAIFFSQSSDDPSANRTGVLRLRTGDEVSDALLSRVQHISPTERLTEIAQMVSTISSPMSLQAAETGPTHSAMTDQNQRQLLETNHCVRCDLRGADLAGKDLDDANLEGADLRGANLTRTELEGAYLVGADLSGANLTRADLDRATLTGARLMNATLADATLRSTMLQASNFQGAILQGADLSGFTIGALATFDNATLNDADLSGAYLEGASFESAHLVKASLGMTFIRSPHENDFVPRSPQLLGRGRYIARTMLKGANFNHADLTQAELNGAELSQTTFKNARLVRATFNWAVMKDAHIPVPYIPSYCDELNRERGDRHYHHHHHGDRHHKHRPPHHRPHAH